MSGCMDLQALCFLWLLRNSSRSQARGYNFKMLKPKLHGSLGSVFPLASEKFQQKPCRGCSVMILKPAAFMDQCTGAVWNQAEGRGHCTEHSRGNKQLEQNPWGTNMPESFKDHGKTNVAEYDKQGKQWWVFELRRPWRTVLWGLRRPSGGLWLQKIQRLSRVWQIHD